MYCDSRDDVSDLCGIAIITNNVIIIDKSMRMLYDCIQSEAGSRGILPKGCVHLKRLWRYPHMQKWIVLLLSLLLMLPAAALSETGARAIEFDDFMIAVG